MRIYSVNPVLTRNYVRQNYKKNDVSNMMPQNHVLNNQVSFKSDSGALKGMFWGALAGLGAAALVVATGGLGAVVAAGGTSCILGGGAGVGAQLGGIMGGLSDNDDDKSSDKDKND